MDEATAIYRPSLSWRIRRLPEQIRGAVRDALFRAAMWLTPEDNLIRHAREELRRVGYDANQKEEDPDKWIQQNLLDLLRVMAMQGHSGFSASYLVSAWQKLARFEPLTPLTGDDDEWVDHGYCKQNKRCGHVFIDTERFDGQAYDIQARIFREPNGSCFTSGDSHQPITFPYTPKSEYVDVTP